MNKSMSKRVPGVNRSKGKVVIFYAGFLGRGTGVVQHLKQLTRGLEAAGYSTEILSLDKLPIYLRYLPHAIQFKFNLLNAPAGFYLRYETVRYLYRWLFQRRIDRDDEVVAVIFEDIYTVFPVKKPAVAVLHALQSHNLQAFKLSEKKMGRARSYEAALIKKTSCPIATVSEPYRQSILRDLKPYGSFEKMILVVPLGLDTSLFVSSPSPKESSTLELVYAGMIEPRKNLTFLLAVMKRIQDRGAGNIHLTFIGDGPSRSRLEAEIAAGQFSDRVRLEAKISHEELIDVLPRYQVMLQPSLKESFSYTLLEAKLAGLYTMVNQDLEVPDEFCDYRLPLKAEIWAETIVSARELIKQGKMREERREQIEALRQKYDVRNMIADTLRLLKIES